MLLFPDDYLIKRYRFRYSIIYACSGQQPASSLHGRGLAWPSSQSPGEATEGDVAPGVIGNLHHPVPQRLSIPAPRSCHQSCLVQRWRPGRHLFLLTCSYLSFLCGSNLLSLSCSKFVLLSRSYLLFLSCSCFLFLCCNTPLSLSCSSPQFLCFNSLQFTWLLWPLAQPLCRQPPVLLFCGRPPVLLPCCGVGLRKGPAFATGHQGSSTFAAALQRGSICLSCLLADLQRVSTSLVIPPDHPPEVPCSAQPQVPRYHPKFQFPGHLPLIQIFKGYEFL